MMKTNINKLFFLDFFLSNAKAICYEYLFQHACKKRLRTITGMSVWQLIGCYDFRNATFIIYPVCMKSVVCGHALLKAKSHKISLNGQ